MTRLERRDVTWRLSSFNATRERKRVDGLVREEFPLRDVP